jgi:hypothetical protein
MHTSCGAPLRRSAPGKGMLVEILNLDAGVWEEFCSHYGRTIGQSNRVVRCVASRLGKVCWEGLAQKTSLVSSMS